MDMSANARVFGEEDWCRHIFALANINQDKTLNKLKINSRWFPPKLLNFSFQMENDNFSFEIEQVKKYLVQNNKKTEDEENKSGEPQNRLKEDKV